jgi:tetratricopeptide (TPR) repeat protein
MGEMFHHMHHYCYGLMKANRGLYLTRDPLSRKYYLRDAVIEYDYVLDHAKPDFILYPEILNRKAEALLRLGDAPRAIQILEEAVEIKPDYWAPYAGLSDYYKDSGNLQKAREILQSGLAAAPDAVGLKRRLDELNAEEGKRRSSPPVKASKGEK